MSCKDENTDEFLENRVRIAAAALYRVTDTFSDNEPMKWKLRNDVIELLDSLVSASQKGFVYSESYYYPLVVLDRLLSKISIVSGGGYISKINFQVLETEFKNIADIIFSNMSDTAHKRQNILSDISIGHYKGHIKDIKDIGQKDNKKYVFPPDTDNAMEEKISKKAPNNSSSISERQKRVTSSLVGKGWLHVVDVATLCGESASTKTIQRDLISLMQSGIVQSKGERRWRTYALVEHNESDR